MNIQHLTFALLVAFSTCTLQAQQPAMPGTNMGQQTSQPTVPGKPNRTKPSADAMPGDMKSMGQDSGNQRAKQAAQSEQNSVHQQAGQANKKPGENSDTSSITVPIQGLQEPEAVGFRTGEDLPAPELLVNVVDRQPLTLENFIDLAEKNNPTLAQAQRNIDRSNQQAHQVSLPPNPTVGYSGDHIRGGSYHGGEEGAFYLQEFVLGRKLALRRDIYRAEGRSNEFNLAIQRSRVHNDVGHSFFDALAAQQSVVIQDRLLKVALDTETNVHELARIGQADASDVLNAEVAAEQAKVDFESAQRTFLSRFIRLATYAGQISLEAHPLTGSLVEPPVIDAQAIVATDTQESPYVKRAQADVMLGEARLRDARRERVPNLTVKAGEWYSGEELGSSTIKAGWESFVEMGVQLPLWNRNQGNIGAAKAELERAHQDVTRIRLWTRNQAEPYAQQYLISRSTAERYRNAMLPRARRSYQLEVMKYQQMAQPYPKVLAAQRMLFTLQLGYVQALNEEWRAAIALQNYVLMNGLEEPMSTGPDSTTLNLPTGGSQ